MFSFSFFLKTSFQKFFRCSSIKKSLSDKMLQYAQRYSTCYILYLHMHIICTSIYALIPIQICRKLPHTIKKRLGISRVEQTQSLKFKMFCSTKLFHVSSSHLYLVDQCNSGTVIESKTLSTIIMVDNIVDVLFQKFLINVLDL